MAQILTHWLKQTILRAMESEATQKGSTVQRNNQFAFTSSLVSSKPTEKHKRWFTRQKITGEE